MDPEKAKAMLSGAGFRVTSEERLANDYGTQLRLGSGQIITIYDSGKCVLGGKRTEKIRYLFEGEISAAPAPLKESLPSRRVFVVYGHDSAARTELEAMLRRWSLEPLILDQLTSGGQTIIEKLESVRRDANFAVVLATPDDEGHRKDHAEEKAFRARQNVVLELGMMLAVLGRPRVAILVKTDVTMERPSDIQGLIYIPYQESVNDAKLLLAKEINSQGIRIDLDRV
jgi:predicted nucleotide-binding protein